MALEANVIFSFVDNIDVFERLLFLDSIRNEDRKSRDEMVEPALAWKHQGDFYGLLQELQIEERFWVPSLYLSGYTSPVQYDGERLSIRIAKDVNYKSRSR